MRQAHRPGWRRGGLAVLASLAAVAIVVLLGGVASADSAFGTQPIEVTHQPPLAQTSIVSVTTGRHSDYDRLVITTTGPLSHYSVRFAASVVNSPKGDPANVPGSYFVTVTVSSVEWTQPLPFPARIDVNGDQLLAVVRTEQFEGYVSLALGLRSRTAFRAFTLTGPDRLVVDVAHPTGVTNPTLPATGVAVTPLVLSGLALIGAGVVLCRLARRSKCDL